MLDTWGGGWDSWAEGLGIGCSCWTLGGKVGKEAGLVGLGVGHLGGWLG